MLGAPMNVEQLRQLEQAATPGPWSDPYYVDDEPGDNGGWVHNGREGSAEYAVALTLPYSPKMRDDAELIAAMRNALPALLDVAETAQDVVPSAEFLDHIPGPYAYVRVDELKAVSAALSRLDGGADDG